jgi:hypothetical protein
MLEQLNGNDAVVCFRLKFKIHNIAGNDSQVLEAFVLRDGVDVFFLRAGVRERGYAGVGEDFGEVEGC